MRPPTSLLKPIAFHTRTRQSIGCSPMFSSSGVVQGDQNVNSLLSRKQPPFCVCRHRIPPRTRSRSNSPKQARGLRPEAGGNSQAAGKLWCDHQQVSNDHEACSWTRKSSVITQHATEVLRLQLRPRSEQERRDKADTAVLQTARRRVRAELRKGK